MWLYDLLCAWWCTLWDVEFEMYDEGWNMI